MDKQLVVSAADTEESPQTKIKDMNTLTKLTLAIKDARYMKKAILALVLLASVITANAQINVLQICRLTRRGQFIVARRSAIGGSSQQRRCQRRSDFPAFF